MCRTMNSSSSGTSAAAPATAVVAGAAEYAQPSAETISVSHGWLQITAVAAHTPSSVTPPVTESASASAFTGLQLDI